MMISAKRGLGAEILGTDGGETGGMLPAAVVVTVIVTFAVVLVLLNVRDVTAAPFCVKLQEEFAGSPEQARLFTVPVKPLTADKVSETVLDCPGLETVIVDGAAMRR